MSTLRRGHPYSRFLESLLKDEFSNILTSGTLKAILLSDSYSPSLQNDSSYSDVSAHEITGTSYTAGGVAAYAYSLTVSDTLVNVFMSDVTFENLTGSARYMAVFNNLVSPTVLVTYFDFGGVISVVAGDLNIEFNDNAAVVFNVGVEEV